MKTAEEKDGGGGKLVDSFEVACANLDISRNKGHKEVAAGRLESYLDGRRRKVTRKAQADYIARKQRASGNAS